MILPATKARWEARERTEHAVLHTPPNPPHCLARCRSEEQVIHDNAAWLIDHLYEPDEEVGAWVRVRYLSQLGVAEMGKERINWGDLGVSEVIRHGKGWQVTLAEASPGRCPSLCEYIRSWLEAWGWQDITVVTEW